MEKRYYDASSLERVLRTFEEGYGLSSREFYESHLTDDRRIEHVPGVHRGPWAGFYRAWLRMSGGGFADRAARELELA